METKAAATSSSAGVGVASIDCPDAVGSMGVVHRGSAAACGSSRSCLPPLVENGKGNCVNDEDSRTPLTGVGVVLFGIGGAVSLGAVGVCLVYDDVGAHLCLGSPYCVARVQSVNVVFRMSVGRSVASTWSLVLGSCVRSLAEAWLF